METWIDGYNVVKRKKMDERVSLEQAREHLLRRVGAFARVVVWFDAKAKKGSSTESPSASVTVKYVTGTADDAIVDGLRRHKDPRSVVVVTDDLALAVRCRQLGAAHVDVDAWFANPSGKHRSVESEGPSSKPKPTKSEIDWGLEQFGHLDDERLD